MPKVIKLSKLAGIMVNHGIHKVQPQKKLMQDYGIPKMRPCGFPSNANPCEKRGILLGNIHKMYKFKSMTGKK